MSADRRSRIISYLYPAGSTELEAARLGEVCAAVTGATGAGLMLMTDDVHRGSVATTDEVSTLIEDLQFTLGEGPCVDAFNQADARFWNPTWPPRTAGAGRVHPERSARGRAPGPCSAFRCIWSARSASARS